VTILGFLGFFYFFKSKLLPFQSEFFKILFEFIGVAIIL